jgi:predicted nicotinamide N-methyase
VTFFDWEPRALEIVRASAARQPGPASDFTFLVGDWRTPPPMGPFDLILGADVLYEQRNAPAVAAFLAGHLKPGAEAWIGDPGRPQAGPFPALAEAHGLQLVTSEIMPPRPHGTEITLLRVLRPFP